MLVLNLLMVPLLRPVLTVVATGPCYPRPVSPSNKQRTPPGLHQVCPMTVSSSHPLLLGCQCYLFLMPSIHFPLVLTRQIAHICCHQEVSIVSPAQSVCPKPTVGLILQGLYLKFQFQSIMLCSWH